MYCVGTFDVFNQFVTADKRKKRWPTPSPSPGVRKFSLNVQKSSKFFTFLTNFFIKNSPRCRISWYCKKLFQKSCHFLSFLHSNLQTSFFSDITPFLLNKILGAGASSKISYALKSRMFRNFFKIIWHQFQQLKIKLVCKVHAHFF